MLKEHRTKSQNYANRMSESYSATSKTSNSLQFIFSYSLHANEQLNIFACEPEWKALADEIGGNKVKSISAILINRL